MSPHNPNRLRVFPETFGGAVNHDRTVGMIYDIRKDEFFVRCLRCGSTLISVSKRPTLMCPSFCHLKKPKSP